MKSIWRCTDKIGSFYNRLPSAWVIAIVISKILCVDDDLTFQAQLSRIVKNVGALPILAGNGVEAIEILKENPDIELVLLDIEMPVMDGFKALEAINSLKEEKRLSSKLSVYILSDRADEKSKEYCTKELYADGYLVKSKSEHQEELVSLLREHTLGHVSAGVNKADLPKVLSVDDAASIQHVMRKLIKKAGGLPIIAGNGVEAINAVKNNPDIKAIFLDIEMPQKNGYETLVEIKEINPNIPVIMLTDRGQEDIKEYCMKMGADDFMLKKDVNTTILEAISSYISKVVT